DASPEVVWGDRCNVAERLPVPLGFVYGRLRDDRPSRASAAALGAVSGECGDTGRAAGQRVDVLVRRDPLGGVDRQRVPETEQQPVRLAVAQPPPLEVSHASVFRPQTQAV